MLQTCTQSNQSYFKAIVEALLLLCPKFRACFVQLVRWLRSQEVLEKRNLWFAQWQVQTQLESCSNLRMQVMIGSISGQICMILYNMDHSKTIRGQRLGATLLAEKRNFQTLPSTSSIIKHGLEACLDFGIEDQILLGEICPLLIHGCHASLSNGFLGGWFRDENAKHRIVSYSFTQVAEPRSYWEMSVLGICLMLARSCANAGEQAQTLRYLSFFSSTCPCSPEAEKHLPESPLVEQEWFEDDLVAWLFPKLAPAKSLQFVTPLHLPCPETTPPTSDPHNSHLLSCENLGLFGPHSQQFHRFRPSRLQQLQQNRQTFDAMFLKRYTVRFFSFQVLSLEVQKMDLDIFASKVPQRLLALWGLQFLLPNPQE